jgi:CBS domain-containing protein
LCTVPIEGRELAVPATEDRSQMTVAVILKHKGSQVESLRPGATLQQAVSLLSTKRIGAAVVLGNQGEVSGVVSERDIVNALAQHGASAMSMPIDKFMTREVVTCTMTDTADGLMEMMTRGRFRHVPVVEGGRLVGIVSIGDVVKRRIEDSDLERHAMREYITQAG